MPSIDINTINFETGSWEIPPDQAARLQSIADGPQPRHPAQPARGVPDRGPHRRGGNDTDNLSLSDRRAESAAELLTQQFQVPAEKPDVAGLWLAISEGADLRTEPHQPARHDPAQSRRCLKRRHGVIAAAPARHRATAVEMERSK